MPGSFIFRPIKAELKHAKGSVHTLDPYCKLSIGKHSAKSRACENGGQHPQWDDAIIVKRDNEVYCKLRLKDKDKLNIKKKIASCVIDLRPTETKGQTTEWYNVYRKGVHEGQILVEVTYTPIELRCHDIKLN